MSEEITMDVNSGVHANVGMDFQKNCTLLLFLEKYPVIKNEHYFIILEHYDDIVFGFWDDEKLLKNVETYQAKKSANKWILNQLLEIIKKIVVNSQGVINDSCIKTSDFFQKNFFITNNTIELKNKGDKKTCTINESNCEVEFKNLDFEIQSKILNGNKDISFTNEDESNLKNLSFKYVDFGRNYKSQLEQLNGKFITVFGDTITDHKAALFTFLHNLKYSEDTFNQGSKLNFIDKKKRLDSDKINKILKVLTTKNLAYNFWRTKSEYLCDELNISILDQKIFELHYENSFDKFKDLYECEHNKILYFVQENISLLGQFSNEIKCISTLLSEFNKAKTTTLKDIQLKAAICAAYIEIKNTL